MQPAERLGPRQQAEGRAGAERALPPHEGQSPDGVPALSPGDGPSTASAGPRKSRWQHPRHQRRRKGRARARRTGACCVPVRGPSRILGCGIQLRKFQRGHMAQPFSRPALPVLVRPLTRSEGPLQSVCRAVAIGFRAGNGSVCARQIWKPARGPRAHAHWGEDCCGSSSPG